MISLSALIHLILRILVSSALKKIIEAKVDTWYNHTLAQVVMLVISFSSIVIRISIFFLFFPFFSCIYVFYLVSF